MPVENVPFFTIQDTPLTNVTPFTFRDGITYVEKLERVARNCQNLVDAINKCIKICNELEVNVNKTVAQLRAETDRKIQYAIDELYRKLAARGGEKVFVTDPVDGVATKTLSEALASMYSNLRTAARFAIEADNIGATAKQLDEIGWKARGWDLDPEATTPHAVRKDI